MKETLVHGNMHYKCEKCGDIFIMHLEKGVEGEGKIQPCPFTIGCSKSKCNGLANHVLWGLDVFFEPRPIENGENYFALDEEYGCGRPIYNYKCEDVIPKSALDRRICDYYEDSTNTQTFREFVLEGDDTFGRPTDKLLEEMTDEEITQLINFYNNLWDK